MALICFFLMKKDDTGFIGNTKHLMNAVNSPQMEDGLKARKYCNRITWAYQEEVTGWYCESDMLMKPHDLRDVFSTLISWSQINMEVYFCIIVPGLR